MSNISIKFKNFSHSFLVFRKNLVIFFYLGFLILIGFEIFVVKGSVNQVLSSKKEQPPSRSVAKVRIKFDDYEENLKRLQSNQNFKSNMSPAQNIFRIK